MSNLEEQLHKIKVRKASEAEKNSMWLGIITKREIYQEKGSILSIFNFKKHMIGALIALLVVLGGGGVVAASNSAVPGDALFGVDLAVEKAKINFAGNDDKKNELRVKFADERVAEAKTKTTGSANVGDVDLSAVTVTEIEVDVFTNETTEKIEANDKHYGFISEKKTKADIVAEIKAKYNLSEEKINAVLSFETEDRASRADDKQFLNSSNSIKIKSEKEKRDFEMSLRSLSDSEELSADAQARLNAAIAEIIAILEANPNSKIKIENGDFKLEVKENGMIKFESEDDSKDDDSDDDSSDDDDDDDNDDDEDDNSGHGNDDDGKDDDNKGKSNGVNINAGAGVNLGGNSDDDSDDDSNDEDGDDENDSDDDSDDDDNDDDSDDDDDDDEDEEDDNSDDDDDDDDNSGSGNGGN